MVSEASMDWPDSQRGVFAISVAAELSGLHPQTLRVYEREGLIAPGRSAGGTRLYSRQDLERLHEIAALTGSGVNIAGVRIVLELRQQVRELRTVLKQGGSPDRVRSSDAKSASPEQP
jgi:MerR family transcriptional regulator, heat shock protein HspR